MRRPEFVIWTPPYAEDNGGAIALHALCHRLRLLGVEAALWPSYKPAGLPRSWAQLRLRVGYLVRRRFLRRTAGPFGDPIARAVDARNAVVVYPEIVAGNPLGARKVVRWLLYRPGAHTGEIDYGRHDLVFYYNKAFDDGRLNVNPDAYLRVTHVHPAYRQVNFGERSGSCYIVRKGKGRILDRHPPGAVLADDLGHEELADLFNRTEFAYSYDPYTFYTVYAALCGCIPIIVPEEHKSEEEWEPLRERRLGLAYGEERIGWAVATRDELRAALERARAEEDRLILSFVETCRRYFSAGSTGSGAPPAPARTAERIESASMKLGSRNRKPTAP